MGFIEVKGLRGQDSGSKGLKIPSLKYMIVGY